jgi:hypothetical protein
MTTLIDPVTNPAMVARSSLAVGAHFAVYDANNVVWRRYIATDLGETNILTGVTSAMDGATQVLPRVLVSVTFAD